LAIAHYGKPRVTTKQAIVAVQPADKVSDSAWMTNYAAVIPEQLSPSASYPPARRNSPISRTISRFVHAADCALRFS